jgi:hypothetical protein
LGGSAGNHQGLTYGTVLVRRTSKKLGGTDGKEAQALKDGALLANPILFYFLNKRIHEHTHTTGRRDVS